MRALAWFLAAILGTLVLAAVVAWPVWQVAHAIQPDWPFHKVVSRLWQLLLLVGLVVAVRRLGLRTREDWGYGLPRPQFLRQMGVGFAVGLATMLPMSLAIVALGIRELPADLTTEVALKGVATGVITGLLVALLEETFFRGLMFRAIARDSRVALAIAATALLYSTVHFLARVRVPAAEVEWDSGLALLGVAFTNFAHLPTMADSFFTLVLVGLMLALVRARTGAIAAGIGLHIGWISVIKTTTFTTDAVAGAQNGWLVGSLDGYTGWLVAGWSLLLIVAGFALGWLRVSPPRADRG